MSKTKQLRRTIRYRIVYFFVKFLIFISNVIPRRTWLSVCGFLGRLAYVFAVQTRRLTLNHLSLAYGEEKSDKEIKKLARKTFEMLGKNAGDILRSR
jgi:KDO2-lipid IV(A) lauroyltransferase